MNANPTLVIPPHVLERVFGYLSSVADLASIHAVNRYWGSVVHTRIYKCLEKQRWLYAFLNSYLSGKNWMDVDWEKEFSKYPIHAASPSSLSSPFLHSIRESRHSLQSTFVSLVFPFSSRFSSLHSFER